MAGLMERARLPASRCSTSRSMRSMPSSRLMSSSDSSAGVQANVLPWEHAIFH